MFFFFLNAIQLIVTGFLLLFYLESMKPQEQRRKTNAIRPNKQHSAA